MPTCFQCGVNKPDSEFYAHPQMKAGHLGKCKSCAKEYARLKRLTDPGVRERERARGRQPHRIAHSSLVTKTWRARNPEAAKAHAAVASAIRTGALKREPCSICASDISVHAHHKDYAEPLDVIWLCARCHLRLHAIFPELEGANKRIAASVPQ